MSERKGLIVKSNRMINSVVRMSLVENQLVLFAIAKARETQTGLSDASFVDIPALDFAAQFGTDVGSVYGQLKSAAEALFERRYIIYDTYPETGKPQIVHTRWISAFAYVPESGVVRLRFAPECVPHITRQESDFTSYGIKEVSGLTSIHAMHLYELLAQYKGLGTRAFGIAELRNLLQVDGQQTLDNFKRQVVDVGVDQINKHSDLTVSYTQRKNGRSITHLVFAIKIKADALPKKIKVDDAYVKAHALPGEKDFDAWQRCRAEVKNPPKKAPPKMLAPPDQPAPVVANPEGREDAKAQIAAMLSKMKKANTHI